MVNINMPGYLILLSPILLPIFSFILYVVYRLAKKYKKNPYLYIGVTLPTLFILVTFEWIPATIYLAYQCSTLNEKVVYKTPSDWRNSIKNINYNHTSFSIYSMNDIPKIPKYSSQYDEYLLNYSKYKSSIKPQFDSFELFKSSKSKVIYSTYKKSERLNVKKFKDILFDRVTGEKLYIQEGLIYYPTYFGLQESGRDEMGIGFSTSLCRRDAYSLDIYPVVYRD